MLRFVCLDMISKQIKNFRYFVFQTIFNEGIFPFFFLFYISPLLYNFKLFFQRFLFDFFFIFATLFL